jgi:peroxiredoxin (alkyl hydroperoxide reductase subunit C)
MIKVGDYVPDVKLYRMSQEGPEAILSTEWFSDRYVVLFAVPGAFTPTCSIRHLPGYVEKSEEFRSKGVDSVACLSVNDVYVMDAWRRDQEVSDQIEMLADGAGLFTKAAGFVLDLSGAGYGIRSIRYAMIVKDGMVTHLNLEESGKFEVSDAETILKLL